MRLPRLLTGAAVVALLGGIAACGAQSLEPKLALREAFGAFTENRAGAVRLSIASSVDDVVAFVESVDPESAGEEVPEELETILSSSLDLFYDLGEDPEDATDDSSSVVIRIDDLVAGEVRSVGEVAYAQADLDGLADRFPGMREGLDEFRGSLTGEDGATGPVPAEIAEPAEAFLDGEWVSVDLQEYLEQMEDLAAAQGVDGTTPSDEEIADIRDAVGAAVADAVTSVERRESDDVGDHLVANVDLREAYATLRDELLGIYDDATGEALTQQLPAATDVPDKQIAVDFWVRDGELKRAELDIAQFADDAAGSFVFRADIGSEREITAPEDAVELDLGAVVDAGLAQLPGATAGMPGLDPAAPLDAYTVATWVDMDIAAIASEDGGRPSVGYLPDVLPFYEGIAPDLAITAVGERVQIALGQDVVCLTPSPEGMSEDIAPGPC